MKTLLKNYKFNAADKTVTILDGNITLDNLLIITNVTTNTIIYNFSAPTKGGVLSGNVLTLTFDTTAMSNTDTLQIFADVDDQNTGLLQRIYNMLTSPVGYDKSLQRNRVSAVLESGTVTTVSTVTTVTGLTNITGTIGNYQANQLVYGQNQAAWASIVRARIT
jgi:hypothetical protein